MGKAKEKRPMLLPEGFQGSSTTVFSMSSGGALVVGGTLTASSAVTLSGAVTASSAVTVGATFTASSAVTLSDKLTHSLQTVSSGQTLSAANVTVLTATGSTSYTLPAVAAGLYKAIMKTANSTAVLTVDTASTATTFDGSSATKLTFNGQNQKVELVGASSIRWLILSSTASVGDIST